MRSVRRGLTLVELLVVIAIVAVVAGIVYTSTGPVRENARRAVCMSNLRQIGLAIKLYREDYASVELGSWYEMGLPPSPTRLKPYLRDERVFRCPNFPPPGLEGARGWSYHYTWNYLDVPLPPEEGLPKLPRFEDVVRQRGWDYVIMHDLWHGLRIEYAGQPKFVIVLRLDGRVQARRVSWGTPPWEY